MKAALITGSCGLVGSAVTRRLLADGWRVVGVDNNGRQRYFGEAGSIADVREDLRRHPNYTHRFESVVDLYETESFDLIVHAAAQPSHDWGTQCPMEDFRINAVGTLQTLQTAKQFSPEAPFIFMSTIKVYGESINLFQRPEDGYDENLPANLGSRSIFGASKLAADTMVQEYGMFFGMRTTCLRASCITGVDHRGVPEHGMLSHLVKCVKEGRPYTINGYGGNQVRDQLWVDDVVSAILLIAEKGNERGEAYNLGGGRERAVSILQAIAMAEEVTGKKAIVEWGEARKADHKFWVTDTSKFRRAYPEWQPTMMVREMIVRLANG